MPIEEILELPAIKLTNQELADLALAADHAKRAAWKRGEVALACDYMADRDDILEHLK